MVSFLENILCVTQEGNRIKIIDFGLARKYDPDKKLQVSYLLLKIYYISLGWLTAVVALWGKHIMHERTRKKYFCYFHFHMLQI